MILENLGWHCVSVEKIEPSTAEILISYCKQNQLKFSYYENRKMFIITIWESREFTRSGDFGKRGLIGKVQKWVCDRLTDSVFKDLKTLLAFDDQLIVKGK